jgi:glycosyltransferase involved in cell wall biosynthesis
MKIVGGSDRLAFAIPYYSGKHYLAGAVESVRRQTNPQWTLTVCDDSPQDDGIAELLAQYADPRIRYRRNPATLGLAGNWNACLVEADGDLVTILHGDDELLENYCDLMLRAAGDYPDAVGCYCDAAIINERGRRIVSLPDAAKRFVRPRTSGETLLSGHAAVTRLLYGNFITCPTMCYKRSKLGTRRFDKRWRFVTDLDLFARLLLDGETLVGLPTIAYAYRRHAASATAQQTATLQRFAEEIEFYDSLAALGRTRDWPALMHAGEKKRIVRLNLAWCLLQDLFALRLRAARAKLALLAAIRGRRR